MWTTTNIYDFAESEPSRKTKPNLNPDLHLGKKSEISWNERVKRSKSKLGQAVNTATAAYDRQPLCFSYCLLREQMRRGQRIYPVRA